MIIDIEQYNNANALGKVLCKCDDCGVERLVEKRHAINRLRCRGCATKATPVRRNKTESKVVGRRFDMLTVTKRVFLERKYKKGAVFECVCDCGTFVTRGYSKLMNGNFVQSCGCYYRKPKGQAGLKRVFARYKLHAQNRGYQFNLSLEQFKAITSSDCYYCGEPPSMKEGVTDNGRYIYNGVDRFDNNIGYEIDNCVPCCNRCNTGKWDSKLNEFEDWVKRIYRHRYCVKTEKMDNFSFS